MTPLLTSARALAKSRDRVTTVLSILAIALPHAVLLAVVGGVGMFYERHYHPVSPLWAEGEPHLFMAYFADIMLIIPALSMGAAAARLGLSRKATTLATLRLIGITPATARGTAVLDTLYTALGGVVLGSLLYALTLPAWSFLTFHDVPVATESMWLGASGLVLCAVLMLVLTAFSSSLSMQRVAIAPLGVVKNSDNPLLNTGGVIATLLFLVAWMAVSPILTGFGPAIGLAVLLAVMATMMSLINVIGVFSVGLLGRVMARFGRAPSTILAGRRLISGPKAVWRSFGALGLIAFMVGSIVPVLDASAVSSDSDAMTTILIHDIRLGLLLLLGISVVLASISTAMQQAIRAVDSHKARLSLADMGAPTKFWLASRRKEVLYPAAAIIEPSVLLGSLSIAPAMDVRSAFLVVGVMAITTIATLLIIGISGESARLVEKSMK